MSSPGLFLRFSHTVSRLAGKPMTFAAACILILLWAVAGPVFHYSETWQLVVNTATTIITFLMVFVLQNTQARDSRELHVKLDELLRALESARTEIIRCSELSDEQLDALHARLAASAKKERSAQRSGLDGVEGASDEGR